MGKSTLAGINEDAWDKKADGKPQWKKWSIELKPGTKQVIDSIPGVKE